MMPTFLIRPLIYLAAVAAIGGALWWLHHHIYTQGREDERAELTAKYDKRDKDAEAAAQSRIRELETQRIAVERKHADDLALVATKLSQEQQNAQRNETVLRARLATRDLILRDPGARGPDAGCGSGVPQVTTAASGGDGQKGAELSRAASEFLLTLTGEADTVARQLAACQDVIRSDRK